MNTIQITLVAAFFAIVSLTNAAPSTQASHHYVVAISAGMSANQEQEVFKQCIDLLLNRTQPGDIVEFLAAPQGNRLAAVVVPEGTARARANSHEYAGKFGALKQFLTTPASVDLRQATQLRLPQLLDGIARSRQPQQILTVLVIGSPLYFASNEREAAFDMEKGLTPSDGMIAASSSESLFGTMGRKGQLQNTTVHWLTPTDDWAVGEMHRHAVMRFWTVFIKEQGATLSTFDSDIARVFERATQGETTPVLMATLDPTDRGLVMRPPPVFRRENAPPVESRINIPPAETPNRLVTPAANPPVSIAPPPKPKVESVAVAKTVLEIPPPAPKQKIESAAISKAILEIPRTPVGRIGIAAVWETSAHAVSTADVDLYVAAHPGAAEVFWKRAEATDAVYYRDIRHAGPQGQGSDWTASWEYVEVKHARLQDVSIWLNIYDTKDSVTGIVRIQCDGKTMDKPFQFTVTRGNHGGDNKLAQRRQSPYWQEIRIRDIFPELYQSDSTIR